MVVEAAINGADSDKAVDTNVENFKPQLRGSKKLQSEMMKLGKECVAALNATGTFGGKYGNEDKSVTQRGQLWDYNGKRGDKGGPHYSPDS